MNDCSICKNYEPVTAKMAGQKTAKGNPGVVQVVRCKDCGFWYVPKLEKGEKLGACGWWSGNALIRATKAEDYCSRGVRKEGEE